MANARYLMPVLPEHSRSAVDRLLEAEERETEKYTITTAKDLLAIKLAAVASVESELHVDETVGMAKEEDDLNEVDESVFFTVNYDKYNMLLRNEMIVDFATEKHNRTAGQIIQAFFDHGKKQMKLISEDDTPPATPLHIANLLPVDVAQRNDIVLQHESMSAHQKQTPGLQDIVRAYISLLQADVAGFVKIKDGAGANQYTVNLAKLRTTMKRRVLESLLRERFGVATCRVARILMEKGKLDENQVQKLAMLPPKDTREKLGQLQLQGFVDIQEVPKSADRTPGRSFHLWYISLDKCYEQLLTDVYRTIANLQQRKKHELNQRSALLQKLDREDVRKNFDLLSDHDKAQLDHMNKLIERLETSKTRLDTMIMILRDF
ncbi:hypothetical protein BC940DRAFT_230913 [Gongronella butleri]|nr:hypothetical protein BC940DRAFT_230913 [Gongronella butleri]